MVVGNVRVPHQVFLVGGGLVVVLALLLVGSRIDAARAVSVTVPSVAMPSTAVVASAPQGKRPAPITSLRGLRLKGDILEFEFSPTSNTFEGKNSVGAVGSGTYREFRRDGKDYLELTFSDGGESVTVSWTWQLDRFSDQETIKHHYPDGESLTYIVQRPIR